MTGGARHDRARAARQGAKTLNDRQQLRVAGRKVPGFALEEVGERAQIDGGHSFAGSIRRGDGRVAPSITPVDPLLDSNSVEATGSLTEGHSR